VVPDAAFSAPIGCQSAHKVRRLGCATLRVCGARRHTLATNRACAQAEAPLAAPNWITFTDIDGNSCRINTLDNISSLTLVDPSETPDSAAYTAVHTSGGVIVVSGAVATVAAALGIEAPTGPGVLCNTPQGTVALASYGTDAVSTADTWYWSEGYNPTERTVTTIACLNGTNVGTDNVRYACWDSDGNVLGSTAAAGALSAVADVFQGIAASSPFTMPAGRVFVGFCVNGTTAAHQTIAASTYANYTGTTAGVMADAVPTITPTTSTTAGVGPFWRLS
jgi:hypothetical protein